MPGCCRRGPRPSPSPSRSCTSRWGRRVVSSSPSPPPCMTDVVEIRGLRVMGTHGVLEEERQRAQPFEVDIDVETDLAAAGRSDDLADTIDYGWVSVQAAAVVSGKHAELIERVAQDIADAVLVDNRISAVTVVVRKLRPPVPLDVATTAVRITRRR